MILRTRAAWLCIALAAGGLSACGDDGAEQEPATTETSVAPAVTTTTVVTATTESPATTATPSTAASTTTTEPAATTEAPAGPSAAFQEIADRGVIRVGVRFSCCLPFGGQSDPDDPATFDGFEPALVRELVDRLFGDIEIELVEVASSAERWEVLEQGLVDLEIRMMSSEDRDDVASWTGPYLLNGAALLVMADSGFTTVADLADLPIGVTEGLRETWLDGMMEALAVAYQPVSTANLGEAVDWLAAGEVAAVGLDWASAQANLSGRTDLDLQVIPGNWADPMPIGIALPLDSTAFTSEVDDALREIIEDGTWAELFAEWFGVDPPYPPELLLDQTG